MSPLRIHVTLEPEPAPQAFIAMAAREAARIASVILFIASFGLVAGIITGAI